MPSLAVAYLDILGFPEYVKEDPEGAEALLDDGSSLLDLDATEEQLNPVDSYGDDLRTIAERRAMTSFQYLLPMSDCVFILSQNPSLMVFQLSAFLASRFGFKSHAYACASKSGDPRDVVVSEFILAQNGFRVRKKTKKWYPLLYRGGVDFGEARAKPVVSLVDRETKRTVNVVGSAVVEAVRLEALGRGPRVRCSKAFAEQVSGDASAFVGTSYDNERSLELYWPMTYFETHTDCSHGLINQFGQAFRPAILLWSHFAGTSVVEHYRAFIRLMVESARRKYPASETEIRDYVLRQAGDLLGAARDHLLEKLLFG